MNKKNTIWDGIFEINEKPEDVGEGFLSDRWLERLTEQLNKYRNEIRVNKESLPPRPSDLPIIVSLINPHKIVDFGGGSGWGYDYINNTADTHSIDEYIVIETPAVCRYLQQKKIHKDPVVFDSNLDKNNKIDLLFTNSTLQYIHDDGVFLI